MTEAAALIQRLAKLEKQLSSFKEITGVDPSSGPFIVTTLSINRDTVTGGYFISFLSQPGEIFQIQSSVDAVVWEVADNSVNAAASPAISSTWLSVPYAPEAIIYFRVRRYPRTLPLPDLNTPVNMSPPLADTPTLQQLLAMVASVQDQINALEYDADVSTRLRDIHTPTQLATALAETGELILRLKAPITLPPGNIFIPRDKTIEFGLHWFVDGGGSTVSFFGKCVAERRTIFVGFVAGDIVGTFGGTDVFPEWWGLTNNLHDVAINCAVRASSLSTNGFGIKVSLANRIYDVSAPIDLSSRAVTLEGAGSNLTYLRSTSNWNATWFKAEVWGSDTGPANHAAMIWIGGDLTGNPEVDGRTYRTKVKGMDINCYNAAFPYRLDEALDSSKRVSGISSKFYVEECSVIHDVVVENSTGFGIGFCRHKLTAGTVGGWTGGVINGLSIRDFWITGRTFRSAYPLYFSQFTNNCTVDTGTVDMSMVKRISSAWNVAPVDPEPAWVVTYPLIGIKAQGNMSVSNVHIEGPVIGVHIPYNSGGGNCVNINNINFLYLQDPIRGAIYYADGLSGLDFTTNAQVTTANAVTGNISDDGTRYFGYGCGVLISKDLGNYQVPWNTKDRVTINNIRTSGGVTYLLRDAMYGKNIRGYGMGEYPQQTTNIGGISFYTRGNAYAYTTTLPYTLIDAGFYDPANPTSTASLSRTFFTGPIY